jgi:putative transposase
MSSKPVAFCSRIWASPKRTAGRTFPTRTPYSERQFHTLKCGPEFPERFGGIQDSRTFCQGFSRCFIAEHRHSGLGPLMPAMVHGGQTGLIQRQRQQGLDAAYQLHPERFVRRTPRPPLVPTQAWINKPHQLA